MSDHRWKPVGGGHCVLEISGDDIETMERSACEDGWMIVRCGDGDQYVVVQLHDVQAYIGPLMRGEGLTCTIQTERVYGLATLPDCQRWIEDQRGVYLN